MPEKFLSGVIRANRFARFARIEWFVRIGNSSDSWESAWRAIKIGVSIWSAANGGLRDGGLRKSEDIWGKRPFSSDILDFPGVVQALWKMAKKAEKGEKRPISADFQDGRPGHPLNPHLLHPHLRHSNQLQMIRANSIRANRVANRPCH